MLNDNSLFLCCDSIWQLQAWIKTVVHYKKKKRHLVQAIQSHALTSHFMYYLGILLFKITHYFRSYIYWLILRTTTKTSLKLSVPDSFGNYFSQYDCISDRLLFVDQSLLLIIMILVIFSVFKGFLWTSNVRSEFGFIIYII